MLGSIVLRGFSFAYASASLLTVLVIATVRDGAFRKRSSKEEVMELQIAQKAFWSVDLNPLPGFSHQFFTLRNGVKLHYVVKTAPNLRKDSLPSSLDGLSPQNVAIFLHGFPDSYLLWKRVLQTSSLDSQILIALDLPGYGGSEGLQSYSANDVLESITEFILAMREKYLRDEAKLVVVSHDWGAIIAARLASEAASLADRWVISSIAIPELGWSNAAAKVASAKQMLHTYLRQPLRISLLKNALSTLSPVWSQVRRSFYIYIFNLPYPLSDIFPTFGNYWFLRLLHKAGVGRLGSSTYRPLTQRERGEAMASSIGPGAAQIDEADGYSSTLKARLSHNGMLEKFRIYREGLFRGPWEKSIETVVALSELQSDSKRSFSASGAGLFDNGPPGALKAPATIIYGIDDPAFEKRLALDGISDYLTKDSQTLILEDSGHWLPLEVKGSRVIGEVAAWALGDDPRPLKAVLEDRGLWDFTRAP